MTTGKLPGGYRAYQHEEWPLAMACKFEKGRLQTLHQNRKEIPMTFRITKTTLIAALFTATAFAQAQPNTQNLSAYGWGGFCSVAATDGNWRVSWGSASQAYHCNRARALLTAVTRSPAARWNYGDYLLWGLNQAKAFCNGNGWATDRGWREAPMVGVTSFVSAKPWYGCLIYVNQ